MLIHSIYKNALLLGFFAVISTGLIATTYYVTQDKIQQNEIDWQLKTLKKLLPETTYNNDLLHDTITIEASEQLNLTTPSTAYVARKNNDIVAFVFSVIAPDGYSGHIKLLVGIYTTGKIAGVRTVVHAETPGLGDKVDENKSDWITHFSGLSLTNPEQKKWKVKKDGGYFDQFTGATITPRAVVKAVFQSLNYFKDNKQTLIMQASNKEASSSAIQSEAAHE